MIFRNNVISEQRPNISHVERKTKQVADSDDVEEELRAEPLDLHTSGRQETQDVADAAENGEQDNQKRHDTPSANKRTLTPRCCEVSEQRMNFLRPQGDVPWATGDVGREIHFGSQEIAFVGCTAVYMYMS